LEEGRGGASLNWAWVQRGVSNVSRVCAYDRPGYGWSDPADAPMDGANTSQQFYAVLQAANESGPYILVGHSLGGAYVRMFAAQHREDVAGLVLVDATPPSYLTTYTEVGLPSPDDPKTSFFIDFLSSNEMRWQMATWLRIVKTSYVDDWKKLPPDLAPEMSTFIAGLQHLRTFCKEPASLSDTLTQIAH
jgi:pimeloyl-ACP methyl ester carboxylesterase